MKYIGFILRKSLGDSESRFRLWPLGRLVYVPPSFATDGEPVKTSSEILKTSAFIP